MKLSEAANALGALAQPTRLEIFRLLVKCGTDGMGAGNISALLKIPKPTLSFHLKELLAAGLINSEREGRSITYRLEVGGIRNLMCFLTDDCCQGRPELCLPDSACTTNGVCA